MRKVSAKYTSGLEKDLPILETEGIVSSETAGRLKTYYTERAASGINGVVVEDESIYYLAVQRLHNI